MGGSMPAAVPLLLILAFAIIVLGDGIGVLDRLFRYLNAPSAHVQDRSSLNVPPPRPTTELVDELGRLGFTRLGEAGIAGSSQRGPVQVWYYVDRDHSTVAGVFAIGGLLGHALVYSWFGDEAVVVTGHRRGEEIDEPNFRFRVIDGTLTDTYRQHLASLPEFSTRFGRPRHLDDMAEVLRLDSHYNQKFARRRLRRALIQSMLRPLVVTYAVAVLFAAYLISLTSNPAPVMVAGVSIGLVAVGALGYLFAKRLVGARPAK